MKYSTAVLTLILLVFGMHTSSEAQNRSMTTEQIAELHRATQVTIDGKKDPDAIPFAIRMKLFFYRYKRFGAGYRDELKQQLTMADEVVLSEYADRHAAEVDRDSQLFADAYRRISARAARTDGMQLAIAIEAETQKSQARAESRYRAVLDKLSTEGRALVTQFAHTRVRPVVMIQNPVLIATAAPDWYKQRVIADHEASTTEERRSESNTVSPIDESGTTTAMNSSGSSIEFSEP